MAKCEDVPITDWLIAECIEPQRRARLLEEFDLSSVAERLLLTAQLVDIKRQQLSRKTREESGLLRHQRIRIEIEVDPVAADLWFNGRCGYRAQYYLSRELGESADRLILDSTPRLLDRLQEDCAKLRRYRSFADVSFADPSAKVWIRQGWLRTAKKVDRHLHVPRWVAAQKLGCDKAKRRARWAAHLPVENILLIGGWFDDEGKALGSLKEDRWQHLRDVGFT